jgi:hypothetical protein
MPHSGDNETSRRGRYRARTRSSGKDGAVPNSLVRRGDGDGGDGSASYAGRTTTRLTGGAGLPARGSAREGVAGRWGRLVSEREGGGARSGCAREGAGRQSAERGNAGARRRGGGRGMGRIRPSRGRAFSFSFYFLIPISIFLNNLFSR